MARVNNPGLIDPDLSSVNLSRSRYKIDLTGTADATSALSALAEAMRGGTEILTARRGSLRINGIVNLRLVPLDLTNVRITLGPEGQILLGGNAAGGFNPIQSVGYVRRAVASVSIPSIKIVGAKGQAIRINSTDYVQLYADTSTGDSGQDYSIAYCEFNFRRADTIEIATNMATPNSQSQWINENDFYLHRTKTVRMSGTYPHNHNRFHGGTFEGGSLIEITNGTSNRFLGVRFEGGGNAVVFGPNTYDNEIQMTWASNPRSPFDDPYVVGPSITDNGMGNMVIRQAQTLRRRLNLLQVNANTCRTFSRIDGATNFAPSGNVTSLRGVDVQRGGASSFRTQQWRLCYSSPDLVPVFNGDSIEFHSDKAIWRPRLFLYDSNRNVIPNGTAGASGFMLLSAGFSWSANGSFYPGTNVPAMQAIVVSPLVRYVRVLVESGPSTLTEDFDWFSISLLSHRHGGARSALTLQAPQLPACTGLPAVGFESVGQVVVNLAGGFSRCTFALDTTAIAAASGQPAVEVATVTGIANGDVVGVVTASGTQWTTVLSISGSVLTLATNLSDAVNAGARVTVNRWVAH